MAGGKKTTLRGWNAVWWSYVLRSRQHRGSTDCERGDRLRGHLRPRPSPSPNPSPSPSAHLRWHRVEEDRIQIAQLPADNAVQKRRCCLLLRPAPLQRRRRVVCVLPWLRSMR